MNLNLKKFAVSVAAAFLMLAGAQPLSAQEEAKAKLITGTVVDSQGEPMTGATVVVVGTQEATATDADGVFKLKAAQGQKLRASFVGLRYDRGHG